jgi:hypothetical protein
MRRLLPVIFLLLYLSVAPSRLYLEGRIQQPFGRSERQTFRRELPPTSHITVVRRAVNLYDKLFHQPQLLGVFFSEMLFANSVAKWKESQKPR